MTIIPKYNIPVGSLVSLTGNKFVFNRKSEAGYEVTSREDGSVSEIPFQQFVDGLKLPGAFLDSGTLETGNRLQTRMGGIKSYKSLPEEQQTKAKFRLALCLAMAFQRGMLRKESGNPDQQLSIRMMDRRKLRTLIKDKAQQLFGEKIHLDAGRGGKHTIWTMPKGRTLARYLGKFDKLHPNESPFDAIVPLDHLKGNRVSRICLRVKELMFKAWEDVGLDTKSPSVSNVRRHLAVLIYDENSYRLRNELPPLIVPSHDTVSKFRQQHLSPTEYLVATKGERYARNKKGRGSTDVRSLLIGERVEIDECKVSLVTSAKLEGIWERITREQRTKLEELDEDVSRRLTILVMIDVASRMPLAWIISDQPKAEATLALLRMATRDKAREAQIYGCTGVPVAAVGIGNVVNDNGTGLRNKKCVAALMGIGAMNTIVRAYSATDKPYIERLFGTAESGLLELLHGYTGGKAGDLPGYDAMKGGVLNIDEFNAVLTRFMIDEYPSMRHMGADIGGRRPTEVHAEIAETRGFFRPIDPNLRRIHLGWEVKVTPTDEGVRVFSGVFFNSDELQRAIDKSKSKSSERKVSVFVDPDNMARATVLISKHKDPIEVELQTTAFADMTLVEILDLMASWRKENPRTAEIHDDRIMRFRRDLFTMSRKLGVERNLPRSYSTFAECQAKAKVVFAGARVIPDRGIRGTIAPEDIMNTESAKNVLMVGKQRGSGILGVPQDTTPLESSADLSRDDIHNEPKGTSDKTSRSNIVQTFNKILGRPNKLKDLE